ncbi:response regulator [Rubrimonas sp.]|uniref:response regulator n=1 Tax=Rubrimonas sp. TaxID=2036015 RepID=UPI002FDEFA4A
MAIVDDDPGLCRAMARLAASLGWEASAHGSGEALLDAMTLATPSHVLLDLHLSGLHGPPLIAALCERSRPPRVIVMTGFDRPGARAACLAAGAAAYLLKPVSRADLERLIGGVAG